LLRITPIVRALTFNQQGSPLLLRVARNIIQSLLEYSPAPEPDPMLLRYLAKGYTVTSGTLNTVRAVALLDRAIAIVTAAWGADHFNTAAVLREKARALVDLGGTANLNEAVLLLDRVIVITTRTLGSGRLETATALQQKAKAWTGIGGSTKLALAVALYDRVIEINTAALGADHLETGRRVAREGECVGADGWIGQPRSCGSALRPRHRDQDGSARSGSPETAGARCTRRRMRW
jgi:hypothetical protein